MNEEIVSHIPGSLEHLEDGDPREKPIDGLLEYAQEVGFDRAYFKYKDVWYTLQAEVYSDETTYYIALKDGSELDEPFMEFDTFLEMLDTPCMPDGLTVRQVWATISGRDSQLI